MALAAIHALPATAQTVVTSAAPERVSVTLYRAPDRGAGQEINRYRPQGFALITETRTVALPAGRAVIRFEGVAGNIFPETAIVQGLPEDVREKNLDADLLSPRSLYDRALGRQVIIRRTDPATGKVREEQATIRSSADGAALLQTGDGYEGLHCSGLPEQTVYDAIPPGLSAKPTLSVETDSAKPASVTLTLSYLAGGFDWQADYVVRLRPGGATADVFAWLTLASSDVTSFTDAGTQVVAGKPNRTADWSDFGRTGATWLPLQCWPSGPPAYESRQVFEGVPPPPPPPPPMMMAPPAPVMDIVVTASRLARQEELGDFKLYRVPDRVTVASNAQKQVALLSKDAVPVRTVYVSNVFEGAIDGVVRTLRAKNRTADGLGLPLPAGRAAVFDDAPARPILLGQSDTDDKAVGEDVEFKLGQTPGVHAKVEGVETRDRVTRYRLTVTNANARPIAYEAKLRGQSENTITATSGKLGKKDGTPLWSITVPANATRTLEYRIARPR